MGRFAVFTQVQPFPLFCQGHAMPLSAPAPRTHLHTRAVTYRGFHREDGLWDIEGELTDTKAYTLERTERGVMPAGTPVHHMHIRVTVDDGMTIRAIETAMDSTPFNECQQGTPPMQQMVGATLGPGWRQAIELALGRTRGCTHLRELLFNLATAAYQTIPGYREQLRRATGAPKGDPKEPPYHVGKCIAWDVNGPVVARHYPKFVGWQPVKRVDKAPKG